MALMKQHLELDKIVSQGPVFLRREGRQGRGKGSRGGVAGAGGGTREGGSTVGQGRASRVSEGRHNEDQPVVLRRRSQL